jgi:uncharacterized protein (TIGR03066 family)
MRPLAALIAGLALCAPAAAAPVPKAKPTTADKLLGNWKLVKSSQGSENAIYLEVEFAKDGKMFIRQGDKARRRPLSVREGKYKLDGEKIDYEIATPGSEKTEILTIKRLTDDELAFDDPDDIREEFVRIKPEKKDDKK